MRARRLQAHWQRGCAAVARRVRVIHKPSLCAVFMPMSQL